MGEHPWIDDERLVFGETTFWANLDLPRDVGDQLVILKQAQLVQRYLDILRDERPTRIVELGVKEGGSTALIALASEPELLLAVDIAASVPPGLLRVIEENDLQNRLVVATGLDQGDREALAAFVDLHSPDREFDLVIDDASHLLVPTRTSFEVLFPRLRRGGLFILEDWSSECRIGDRLKRALPDEPNINDRLADVVQIVQTYNAGRDLPAAVQANIDAEVHATSGHVFERLIEAAGRADLSALDPAQIGRTRPLADFAVELTMISATRPDLVAEVTIDGDWVTVRRGPGPFSRDGFRLSESWSDFFDYLH
jgi:predicted O-methyltransferase YrrM